MRWLRLLGLLFPASVAAAQSLETRADAIVNEVMRQTAIAGVSVRVVRHGSVLVARGYGRANLEFEVPATADTVYHLASIGKHLTASAVLHLVQKGKLSLDDPITRYLDGAPAGWSNVHVRDLLNHTSGLRSFTDLPEWTDATERLDHTHKEIFDLIARQAPEFPPRSDFKYNNSGFYLAGLVIEKVAGRSYGDFMREELFSPLGLMTARYCEASDVVPQLATGYRARDGAFHPALISWTAPFSSGAICATAADVVAWEQALSNGTLVDAGLLAQMREPTRFANGGAVDYGLGARRGQIGGHRLVGHTGGGGGYRTAFEYFPDDDLTVVVLANTETRPGALEIAGRIARAALAVPDDKPLDLPVPVELRAALRGTYQTSEARVETFARDDRIRFRPAGTPGDGKPMSYQGDGWFLVDRDVAIHFDVAGPIVEMNAYTAGMCMDYGRKRQ